MIVKLLCRLELGIALPRPLKWWHHMTTGWTQWEQSGSQPGSGSSRSECSIIPLRLWPVYVCVYVLYWICVHVYVHCMCSTLTRIDEPYPMLVLCGPPGSGKGYFCKLLVEEFPSFFGLGWVHLHVPTCVLQFLTHGPHFIDLHLHLRLCGLVG